MINPNELDAVVREARSLLADDWEPWPGGYPKAIELALIDAVFSIRARYGSAADLVTGGSATGVQAVVLNWRQRNESSGKDDLRHITAMNRGALVDVLRNASKTAGRLKSEVVWEAAANLTAAGINSSEDFRNHLPEAKAAYTRVHGLGWVTFRYLCMLIDVPDVKPDTWIVRFVRRAVGRECSPQEAGALVSAAAGQFQESSEDGMPQNSSALDHALWHAQRRRDQKMTRASAA